jgi:DNA-binding FadR family transcriptional regulator
LSIAFDPLPFEPGYRRIASAISARILDRTLKDGDPLPSELELAAQFAVNRSTVREALRELESANLVTRRRGTKRLVVARPGAEQVADRMSHALALHDVTVREVWAMLEVLEPPAAEAAARAATPAAVERLRGAVRDFAALPASSPQAVAGVAEFFRAIAAASGNRVLPLMQEPLLLMLGPALALLMSRVPVAHSRIASAQAEVLAAIERGDADTARSWMGKHVRDFRRGFDVSGIALDTPVPAPTTGV